jgi:cytochrome c biogenesis protein CcdA/thiol-disulfide isomerase/thioredoxin
MLLALLAFLGGALTIVSPCILPVLPFVFARNGQSFARTTLPLLAGMAVTFAALATLAAVGGAWAVRLNSYGRILALLLLAAFGVALISRSFAAWLARPFVALGNRLLQPGSQPGVAQSALLGVATGFLWAPCAGPILGLILTGAAISGPSAATTLLLFAYSLGAITSLALVTLAGRRIAAAFTGSLGATEWLRRALGVAVLAGVAAIAFGWDTGLLTRLSYAGTNRLEQSLIESVRVPAGTAMAPRMDGSAGTLARGQGAMSDAVMRSGAARAAPPVEGELPSFAGAAAWLNSPPLTPQELRGRVVLVDFWTYSCINCLRSLPYIKAWNERYKDHGLTIVGVHSPEFAFEKDEDNVRRAVRQLGVSYPVALDNDLTIWRAFNNQYWPAHYFIDAQGRIRGHHFGEGEYPQSEQLLRTLLIEAGYQDLPPPVSGMQAQGVERAADENDILSPETYLGFARAENFVAREPLERDRALRYSLPEALPLNGWSLAGTWNVGDESAVATESGDRLVFRFHARDLHLVLGPGPDGQPVKFRVTLDGAAPGASHGADTDASGSGEVREQRLYQLIRQAPPVQDRTFTIEFLTPGVRAYSFTFG